MTFQKVLLALALASSQLTEAYPCFCPCPDGQYEAPTLVCIPQVSIGKTCTRSDHCSDGYCETGKCAAYKAIDTPCANNDECETHTCQTVCKSNDGVIASCTFTNPQFDSTNAPYGSVTFESKAGLVDISTTLFTTTDFGKGWHVHENPKPANGDCAGTGGHWNPRAVNATNNPAYAPKCATSPADCEVGDLWGRMGALTATLKKTDKFVKVTGPESIIGKSLVIHKTDGTRWACCDIKAGAAPPTPVPTPAPTPTPVPGGTPTPVPVAAVGATAVATFTSPGFNSTETPTGTITFTEVAGGVKMVSTLVNPASIPGTAVGAGWHVHITAVPADKNCAGTGGHWNPTSINTTDKVAYTTACKADGAKCEVGDLSTRWGPLTSTPMFDETDKYIKLSGVDSIVGRSITIHKADGSRWACADIVGGAATAPTPVTAYQYACKCEGNAETGPFTKTVQLPKTDIDCSACTKAFCLTAVEPMGVKTNGTFSIKWSCGQAGPNGDPIIPPGTGVVDNGELVLSFVWSLFSFLFSVGQVGVILFLIFCCSYNCALCFFFLLSLACPCVFFVELLLVIAVAGVVRFVDNDRHSYCTVSLFLTFL